MSTFILPLSDPPCVTWSNTALHSQFLQCKPEHEFHKDPYKLRSVTVQTADRVGSGEEERLVFVEMHVEITNVRGESLPGGVLLRGGSVAMLLILQPDDLSEGSELDKHVIMTIQARVAAGSLGFAEIPAGTLDDSGTFSGVAAKEIGKATGLKLKAEDFIDMTALALSLGAKSSEELQSGVYMSPGGCDEFMPIFLNLKRIPRWEFKSFQGKMTGRREEGEKITLKVVTLEDLWIEGARDAKALAALALYCGQQNVGKI